MRRFATEAGGIVDYFPPLPTVFCLSKSLTLVAILSLFLLLPPCLAQTPIAILGNADNEQIEADCLAQKLSEDKDISLVERSEIDRILKERNFTPDPANPDKLLSQAAAIAGAKGLIAIKSFKWDGSDILSARLIDTASGATLGAWAQDVPSKEAGVFAEAVAFKFKPLFQKLGGLDKKDFFTLSLLNLRCAVDSLEAKELERKLALLLAQRLACENDFLVLERWRLSNVAWEKELNLDKDPLWTGACLLDGSIELPDAQGEVKATLRLRFAGGKTESFEVSGPKDNLKELVEKTVPLLLDRIAGRKADGTTFTWNMRKEAEFYLREAEWLLRAGAYERAREAADASSALGMKGPEISFAHIRSFLGELGYAMQEGRETAATAKKTRKTIQQQTQKPRLAESYYEKLVQALDVYLKFLEAGPKCLPPPYIPESDWRLLGEKLLHASADTLDDIFKAELHLKDQAWAVKAKHLRTLARQAAALTIEKGDSSHMMSPFYATYLCNALARISESPEDFASEMKRILERQFPLQPQMRVEIRRNLYVHGYALPLNWSARQESQTANPLDGYIKELNMKDTPQTRVDALVLEGAKASPEKIDALLWELKDELLEGRGAYGACPRALLFNRYKYTKISCLKLLRYAFAQDKLYYGGVLIDMVESLVNAKAPLNIGDKDCQDIADAWTGYYGRVKAADEKAALDEHCHKDPRMLLAAKGGIERTLAKISGLKPSNDVEGDIETLTPSLSIDMKEFFKGRSSFAIERCLFKNGELLLSGHFRNSRKSRAWDRAYLLAIDENLKSPLFTTAPNPEGSNSAADILKIDDRRNPAGLMDKDGKDVYFADHNGRIFVRSPDNTWNLLADTDFKMAAAMDSLNGKVYVGYGHWASANTSQASEPSGIVQVDGTTGEAKILASSRRNPPLGPLDNVQPWCPDVLTCSGTGALMARVANSQANAHFTTVYLLDLASCEVSLKYSVDNAALCNGELLFSRRAGNLGEYVAFERKSGDFKKLQLARLWSIERYREWQNAEYGNFEVAERNGKAIGVRQLDEGLFIIDALDLASGKFYEKPFSFKQGPATGDCKFLTGIELSDKTLFMLLGSSKRGEMLNASICAVPLSDILKTDFESDGKAEFYWQTHSTQPNEPLGAAPESLEPGVVCKLYKGAWGSLPNLSRMEPSSTQRTTRMEAPKLTSDECQACRFEGFFNAPKDGEYKFCALSAGSLAYNVHMDESPLVFKPCPFWNHQLVFSGPLKAGLHKISIDLMSNNPSKRFIVLVRGPGDEKFKSAESLLFRPKPEPRKN